MELTVEQIKVAIKEAIKVNKLKATLTISECVEYTGIIRDKLMELAHSQNSDFQIFA